MSTAHLEATKGDIAESILLPGDPLRAKYISEKFLSEVTCYNQVRGMLGFTGLYNGKRVSVQGTGMGMPSISIYVNELISEYGVKNLIRIGTCGSLHQDIGLRDVIIAMSASTNSAMNKLIFNGMDYAPTANFELLLKAWENAGKLGIIPKVGNVLTSDTFYSDNKDEWKKWAEYGVLAGEMETSALYTLASKFKVNALSLLTVSDSAVTGEETTAEERQLTFDQMIEIALESV